MKTSEHLDQLIPALAAARLTFGVIERTKAISHFGSKYAPLEKILAAVDTPLAQHNLVLLGEIRNTDHMVTVTTRLMHSSEQWMESAIVVSMPGLKDLQELGKAITYIRRYSISTMLNVQGDDDLDDQPRHEQPSERRGKATVTREARTPQGEALQTSDPVAHPTAPQVSALVELSQSGGIDLASFGYDVRTTMNLPAETKITKKFIGEHMTMTQYEALWGHYSDLLTHEAEQDIDPPSHEDDGQDFSSPVVDLASETDRAPTPAPEPQTSRASDAELVSPSTTAPEKPRLPNKAELLDALDQERQRLSDQFTDAVILARGFGDTFTRWEQVHALPPGSLRNPLKRLQAITTEQPPADPLPTAEGATASLVEASASDEPCAAYAYGLGVCTLAHGHAGTHIFQAEEDVPDHPPPEGNPQDGPQQPPQSTHAEGTTSDAEVDSNVEDEAAWLRDAPPEQPEVMSMGPNKGRVVNAHVITLESWAERVGHIDTFTRMTQDFTVTNGMLVMRPDQYTMVREAILRAWHERAVEA